MFSTLEEAVWEDDGGRKKTTVGKLEISVPADYKLPRPVFCPCCRLAMRDVNDSFSWASFRCCYWCDSNFVRPNRKAWDDGWRPSDEALTLLLIEKGRMHPSYDPRTLED